MKALKLISKAQELLSEFPPEYEKAGKLFHRAFRLEPMNSAVLSAYGEYMTTIGNFDMAKELLERSISVNSKDDYVKYFNLAQILDGEESLFIWKKGIELLVDKIKKAEDGFIKEYSDRDKINLMKSQLCSAFCAISELYMTDLCDNENAESEVQKYLSMASEVDGEHFETLCCKLTYFKTICNKEECEKIIFKIRKLLSNCTLVNFNGNIEKVEDKASIYQLPDYTVRLNLSRTLIDLNETEFAEEILNSLLFEDEEDWQVWYLFSWCHLVSNDIESAIESLESCKKYGAKHIQDTELKERFNLDIENLEFNISSTKKNI